MNDLTVSNIERQNVLNNQYAIARIQDNLGVTGMFFDDEYLFTKKMVADFYDVDISTIDRYLLQYPGELKQNGYFLCKGKRLKEFKLQFAHVINEASKTTQLGLFNFRAFLNIGMLLTESEKAKQVRSLILDIVIATLNERAGGGTKYINRRDANYLPTALKEVNYRKQLTSALRAYVDGHETNMYSQVTNAIYKAVFRENAKEYREILRLDSKDNVRHTLYAEVLLVIASFENGVGAAIREKAKELGRKLTISEVEELILELADAPMQKPYLDDARTKMASRDLSFRDAYHGNIEEYLRAVSPEEYERFIGERSLDIDQILDENTEVLKRLKQADEDGED
jgi:predicted nucleic acid-binding protein